MKTMRIEHAGIVQKVYKDPVELWRVKVKRTDTPTRGITTYIGIKVKPKLKEGQKVKAGDEI